jgi:uncharacterized protein YjiS (DUF1127 family)
MTTFDTSRPVAGPRVLGSVADLFARLAAWNDARVTRGALSRLTDRELDDIGLSRGDIDTFR